jgi:gluconate 2-dehydrogenase gamma chain
MSKLPSRRAFLTSSGAALGAFWLTADSVQLEAALQHAAHAARSASPPPFEVLTPEQAADVEAFTAHLVPSDELPGAREAGVVYFIDRSLATWASSQRDGLVRGLEELNRDVASRWPGVERFAQLPAARQLELVGSMERSPLFQQLRFATVVGMFSLPSYGGNRDGAGWRVLGFEGRFNWQPPFGDYDREAGDLR